MTSAEVIRDQAMAGRVARTLEDAGVAPEGIALVVEAHRLAMAPRLDRILDPHDPDFLHPGRTALILLLDTPLREPVALAAATLVESERVELRVGADTVRRAIGDTVADFVATVPIAHEGLVEALVTAPTEVCMVALAERLDHCRHAKFWKDPAARVRIHEQAEAVLGPVAERTDPALARRFAHWAGAFGRTLDRER
jgi:(p)ppGpp synthase/HD superfamily hydrolase